MYKAYITSVVTRQHPNADRIKIAVPNNDTLSATVIVSLDTQDGDVGIFFPSDGELHADFLTANKLYRDLGGYFEDNGSVRAQNFRGVRSTGFWCPLKYLDYIDDCQTRNLTQGEWCNAADDFSWSGWQRDDGKFFPIFRKRHTLATLAAIAARYKAVRVTHPMFPDHVKSQHFFAHSRAIKPGVIVFTHKLHGTSGRFGNIPFDAPLLNDVKNRFVRWLQSCLGIANNVPMVWKHIIGTRTLILGTAEDVMKNPYNGYYGDNTFRASSLRGIKLPKGMMIYYELVGYHNSTELIMEPQPLHKFPSLKQRYGDTMRYTYGCDPGELKLFVYRVTQVGPDGNAFDLSWSQMVAACRSLGLTPVPLDTVMYYDGTEESYHRMCEMVKYYTNAANELGNHIREGIVLRCESNDGGVEFIKSKSEIFYELEGLIKSNEAYVDLEEAS